MKKNSARYWIVFIPFILTLVPGCKKKSSLNPYLRPLTSYIDYQSTKQGITLRAKFLSARDCIPFLGNNAHRLFKRHRRRPAIFPIQLSITNNTNKLAALEPKDIDLRLTDYHNVAERLHRNSFIQAFGGIAAGLLITATLAFGSIFALSASGMLLVIIGSIKALAPIAIFGGSALLITPVFLVIGTPVVSTIKGVKTARHNRRIKNDIKEHSLKHALVVEPGETIDTLIFVQKNHYKDQFFVTFVNPENTEDRIPFHVRLQKDISILL